MIVTLAVSNGLLNALSQMLLELLQTSLHDRPKPGAFYRVPARSWTVHSSLVNRLVIGITPPDIQVQGHTVS